MGNFKYILLCILFIFLNSCSNISYKEPNHTTLKIIHINDIHSHLEPSLIELKIDNKTIIAQAGGLSRIATEIKKLKKDDVPYLLLNAGDILQGTIYYTIFKGKPESEIMNKIGFDAISIGNHEFDDGDLHLSKFINSLHIKTISSNIFTKNNSPLKNKIIPFIIKEINNDKIAIIGVTTVKKTIESSNPGKDIEFKNEYDSIKKVSEMLNAKGIKKIILLSHIGYKNDIKLAKKLKYVDVIIGGDSHTLLGDFNNSGLISKGMYPTKIYSENNKLICIAQAWSYSKAIGELFVTFDKNGNVFDCNGRTVLPLSNDFKIIAHNKPKKPSYTEKKHIIEKIKQNENFDIVDKNEKINDIINKFKNKLNSKIEKSIGTAKTDIINVRIPNKKYKFGSELTPIISKAYYNAVNNADLVIQNAGGVRDNILQGKITIKHIYEILPFGNTLYEFKLKGFEIKKLLEDTIKYSVFSKNSSGAFPYPYAIRYDIKINGNNVNIFNLEILSKKTNKWEKFDLNKTYTLITHSYLAKGKNGYTLLKNKIGRDLYLNYTEVFIKYIQKNKILKKLNKLQLPIKSYTHIK